MARVSLPWLVGVVGPALRPRPTSGELSVQNGGQHPRKPQQAPGRHKSSHKATAGPSIVRGARATGIEGHRAWATARTLPWGKHCPEAAGSRIRGDDGWEIYRGTNARPWPKSGVESKMAGPSTKKEITKSTQPLPTTRQKDKARGQGGGRKGSSLGFKRLTRVKPKRWTALRPPTQFHVEVSGSEVGDAECLGGDGGVAPSRSGKLG